MYRQVYIGNNYGNKHIPPIYKKYRQTVYIGNVLVRVRHSSTKFKQVAVENDKEHFRQCFRSKLKSTELQS